MGDANPIRTFGDYSKPSHEGYKNTIELPVGNNVAITLPQDVPSTSNRHLIKLKNQVQRLMEAHLAPTQPTQVNKITTSCEICDGPHDTQYCMEDPKQAFVEYASSRTNEVGGKWNRGLVPLNLNTELVCTKGDDGDIMFIEIVKTNDDSHKLEPKVGEQEVVYFDIFPTRSELAYHKYLVCGLIPSIFLRNPIITEGCPSNLKIPCNIGHVHMEKVYIDPNSPLNIMTRMMYNWDLEKKNSDAVWGRYFG
ncbi:hypothetical protein Tco_1232158 [Tanacetum coccineum]